jgi:hypothetical protein
MQRMNVAVKHMMRNRRQEQGKRQPEPMFPPIDVEEFQDALHPAFAWTPKDYHEQRTNLFMPPAFETNELQEYLSSYKPSSELDPLPFSDFYANGNKIRPWGHRIMPSYLAIAEWEGVADDEFKSGKGSFMQHVPQYAGYQNPIDITPLIPEPQYTTYGALNQMAGNEYPAEDAYLFS